MDNRALHLSSVLVASAGKVFSPGGLLVSGGRVLLSGEAREVSRFAPAGTEKIEYPGSVIFPGLVNAHTHLTIPPLEEMAEKDFVGWLFKVMAWRMGKGEDELRAALDESMKQCVRGGITTAGEISGGDLSLYEESPIRMRAYLEVLGMEEERWEELLNSVEETVSTREGTSLLRFGISPHSPYSCSLKALTRAGKFSVDHDVPLQIHMAESPHEIEFVKTGGGAIRERIFDALQVSDGGFSGYGDGYLGLLGESLPSGSTLVHVTCLTGDELRALAMQGFNFVFCIRSNIYLTGRVPVLDAVVDGDSHFGIGTDSRGSCQEIDMFEEMRAFADAYHGSLRWSGLSRRLFDAATNGGARILKFSNMCGTLEEGREADFCVLELSTDKYSVLSHIIEKGEGKRVEEVCVSGQSVIGF